MTILTRYALEQAALDIVCVIGVRVAHWLGVIVALAVLALEVWR